MSHEKALEALDRKNPEWRPWLAVVREVLAEIDDAAWDAEVPRELAVPADGVPLLAGHAFPQAELARLQRKLTARGCPEAALAGVLPMPFLHACRRRLLVALSRAWSRGYCPLCGAWPAFAEVCGVERRRYLRCGGCGCAWQVHLLSCPYCANAWSSTSSPPSAASRGRRAAAIRSHDPRELCSALLAALHASEGRRRRRKRDQTPDAIGLALKRELLERAVADDPPAEAFEAWLLAQAENPMAATVLEEWRLAHALPQFADWLAAGAASEDAAPVP